MLKKILKDYSKHGGPPEELQRKLEELLGGDMSTDVNKLRLKRLAGEYVYGHFEYRRLIKAINNFGKTEKGDGK